MLPARCKRHPVLTFALAWVLVMTPVGMVAEASFDLEYEPGVEHSEGLRFLPAIEGVRTQPAPVYEPVRASGSVSGPSVTIHQPAGGKGCYVEPGTPPYGVLVRESLMTSDPPHAQNAHSTASGCWQFIDGTWDNYKGYAHAKDAPVSVQNEKAKQVWAGGRGCGHWSYCGR